MGETDDETRHADGAFDSVIRDPDARSGVRPVYADTAPHVLDFSHRPARAVPHASALEWVALVLSVVAPPVGLVASILARSVTRHRRHWTTTVGRASTIVSVVLTIALGGGVVAYTIVSDEESARADVLARAQPLCTGLASTPGVLESPAFGWPTAVMPLPVTLESMRAYQAHWAELASLAPAAAEANVRAIADQAQILVGAVEVSQSIDRTANLATMTGVTDASGLPAWFEKYCDSPD